MNHAEGWDKLVPLLRKFNTEQITEPEMKILVLELYRLKDDPEWPGRVTDQDKVAASMMIRAIESTRVN